MKIRAFRSAMVVAVVAAVAAPAVAQAQTTRCGSIELSYTAAPLRPAIFKPTISLARFTEHRGAGWLTSSQGSLWLTCQAPPPELLRRDGVPRRARHGLSP